MTQDELDRIEARVQAWRTAHQIDSVECMAASADDVPALVDEVKRLRGLVEAAYREGWKTGTWSAEDPAELNESAENADWQYSQCRKALEIAAEQFVVEASGTVEGHVAALLNEAREALGGT